MQHSNINGRFKDAPWYQGCMNESILVVGAGGISSNSLYYLAKTIPATYYVVDNDTVDEINIGTQFFSKSQIGSFKVGAMANMINDYSSAKAVSLNKLYTNEYCPITITGLDNMKTRKEVYEQWKSHEDREILIDGRLRANLYEIYVVLKGREAEYEATLFDDSEVDDGPCTFKQTAYFAGLIGSRITHVLVNYLSNKYSDDPVCEVPFSIKEVGDLFYVEIKNSESDLVEPQKIEEFEIF